MSNKVPILILLDPSDEQKIIFVVQSIFYLLSVQMGDFRTVCTYTVFGTQIY